MCLSRNYCLKFVVENHSTHTQARAWSDKKGQDSTWSANVVAQIASAASLLVSEGQQTAQYKKWISEKREELFITEAKVVAEGSFECVARTMRGS